nr:ATP-binding cassette domain-containing protein [Chlorobaculum parvum]
MLNLTFKSNQNSPSTTTTMPQPTTDIAIQTDRLTRSFGSLVAVNELNLTVRSSEIFGLLGPNGAGKTTTIKMLTTMLPPTSGAATVAGHSILGDSIGVRKRIGYVSQMISADGALTGFENLLLFARIYNVPRRERTRRIDEALAFMGLTDARDKLVRTYSGGMIRRLEIALSMLHRPEVLFLDEPTIGLDPAARLQVWKRLKELLKTFGTTILLTTHDMEEAEELCDRIAIMKEGVIAAEGSAKELKHRAGTDSMNQVFIHFAGEFSDSKPNFRDINRTRRTAKRLG